MKKISLGLLTALVVLSASVAHALPLLTNVENNLNYSANAGPANLLGTQIVSNKVQLLKCRYDVSVQTGAPGVYVNLLGPDNKACLLPANAIIIEGMIDILTAPTSSGASAEIQISSGGSSGNLKTHAVITGYRNRLDLIPVGTAATALKLASATSPTMVVTGGTLTTGKFNVFIQYLLSN